MSDPVSVLIVDDNKQLCELLTESINSTGDMRVAGTASDGKTAMDMIRELEPDVVLLDIIIPNLDGLAVLEGIAGRKDGKRPAIIVSTSVGSESIIKRAMELGADYYILKPFEISVLITRIRQICLEEPAYGRVIARSDVEAQPYGGDAARVVTELIRSIGVTPNLSGFNYLREAVLLGMEQPARLENVSRNIYTILADRHGTKARNIDRAIRCALTSAQNKTRNSSNLMNIMQDSILFNNGRRPNNSQVIAFLAKKAGRRLLEARSGDCNMV
ncbi:MAG TPA: sporulation transcription factor Spo0A [Clostridiales bacterium]|nr:sporulation transcription factor Spo0A [Clostridiales bacterium]HOL91974.1 sporulation transcription factor Spo0A [Clostridiales bacterium]HPP35770.1 sporulation transcription factor Spo0A [Clostridiales bacterium]